MANIELVIKLQADYRAPPHTASGKTFSHVFGTTTSSLEQLILAKKLRGPSWLHIENPSKYTPSLWACLIPVASDGVSQQKSWCRIECTIDNPSSMCVADSQPDPPPLVSEH